MVEIDQAGATVEEAVGIIEEKQVVFSAVSLRGEGMVLRWGEELENRIDAMSLGEALIKLATFVG